MRCPLFRINSPQIPLFFEVLLTRNDVLEAGAIISQSITSSYGHLCALDAALKPIFFEYHDLVFCLRFGHKSDFLPLYVIHIPA